MTLQSAQEWRQIGKFSLRVLLVVVVWFGLWLFFVYLCFCCCWFGLVLTKISMKLTVFHLKIVHTKMFNQFCLKNLFLQLWFQSNDQGSISSPVTAFGLFQHLCKSGGRYQTSSTALVINQWVWEEAKYCTGLWKSSEKSKDRGRWHRRQTDNEWENLSYLAKSQSGEPWRTASAQLPTSCKDLSLLESQELQEHSGCTSGASCPIRREMCSSPSTPAHGACGTNLLVPSWEPRGTMPHRTLLSPPAELSTTI